MTLEHSARVAYARQVLAQTEGETGDLTRGELADDRYQLRAALEQVLAYNDELLKIVNEAAMNDHVRLSVNVSHAAARAFRELVERKGVTITDGVRRAIAMWRFVEDEVAAGNQMAVIDPDGTVHKVSLLDGERP